MFFWQEKNREIREITCYGKVSFNIFEIEVRSLIVQGVSYPFDILKWPEVMEILFE